MISYLEALNYQCLRHVFVDLENFHILVGPNASGKSTFLDVIQFLGDTINGGPEKAVLNRARTLQELVWKQEASEFQLAVVMRIPEIIQSGFPQNGKKYSYCRYEIKVGVGEKESGIRLLAENFFLLHEPIADHRMWKKQDNQLELFPEEHEPPESIIRERGKHTPKGQRRVISLHEDGRAYFHSETTDWNFPLRPGVRKTALSMVPEEERFPISTWAKSTLSEGLHVLTLNSRAMREPCRPYAPLSFRNDGSNLPVVVRNLQTTHPERFKMWVEHVKTALPNIHTIDIRDRELDNFPYIIVEFENGITVPSWLLSDGTLRLFALTLLAYNPSQGQVFLIEEPENGIHPKALEVIFQSLSSVSDGQVLCATHSPLMLGLSKPEHLLCFAMTESGATDIVKGTNHPVLKKWTGQLNLETLYAAGVL